MLTTIEAEVDANGNIRPTEDVTLPPGSRVLITVLSALHVSDIALLSEEPWPRTGTVLRKTPRGRT